MELWADGGDHPNYNSTLTKNHSAFESKYQSTITTASSISNLFLAQSNDSRNIPSAILKEHIEQFSTSGQRDLSDYNSTDFPSMILYSRLNPWYLEYSASGATGRKSEKKSIEETAFSVKFLVDQQEGVTIGRGIQSSKHIFSASEEDDSLIGE